MYVKVLSSSMLDQYPQAFISSDWSEGVVEVNAVYLCESTSYETCLVAHKSALYIVLLCEYLSTVDDVVID